METSTSSCGRSPAYHAGLVCALVPVVGKLSDLYGRKPFILAGIVVFVVGSWLCGAAGDMITG